jgi:hypothetical protein
MEESLEEFLERCRKRNREFVQYGIDNFWWETYKVTNGGSWEPVPFPYVFVMDCRWLRQMNNGLWETIGILEPHQNTMAHVLAAFDIFASVSEAKKNGWHKPITPGEYLFKKTGRRLVVEEE